VNSAEEIALGRPETASSGQAPGLDEVFREYYPRMVQILTRLVGERGRAEDIASDVFCKLARRPAFLRPAGGIAGWICRASINAGLDALRADARRRRREQAAGVECLRSAPGSGALEGMLEAETRARVRDVLSGLKPRDAQILLLRTSGLAYRDIAQAVGVAAASVGTLLARAEAEFERRYRSRYGDSL
jgi:RNA polymerase sigma-70 factor (ECF subfamily)